jgi:hypothetical protein
MAKGRRPEQPNTYAWSHCLRWPFARRAELLNCVTVDTVQKLDTAAPN